jgi:hypothetical protein
VHLHVLAVCVAVITASAAALIVLVVTRPRDTRRCGRPGCLCQAGPEELHGSGTDPYVLR